MTRQMTQRLALFFALSFLIISSVNAAKYAGDAFTLGVGARGMGMGNAIIAGPFDASAPYWNPAGMNTLSGKYLMAMHAETFGSLLNHDFVGFTHARPEKQNGFARSYGFYLYYLGGGGIKLTAQNDLERPVVIKEVSHADILLAAALSGKIKEKVDVGVTAKIIYRDIGTESGVGLTLDIGALYPLREWATVGLMITDATTGFIRYSGETFDTKANTESIYPAVKPGLTLEHTYQDFTGRFATAAEIRFENLKDAAQYWSGAISLDSHFGWEIGWREMLFGRAGFDIGRFTAGGGVNVRRFTIDFAYLHHSQLDETFRVSAGYQF